METIALGFARPVTRTYTLRVRAFPVLTPMGLTRTCSDMSQVKSKNVDRGHINGWNREWHDWEWDSGRLREFDVSASNSLKRDQ